MAAAGRARSDMTPPRPAASRTRARDARTTRIYLVTFANRTGARSPVALILGTSSHLRFVSSARSDRSLLETFARPTFVRLRARSICPRRKFRRRQSFKFKRIKVDQRFLDRNLEFENGE